MSLYVAAYDVSQDRRRRRVAAVLLRYGMRVQESVFELWLDSDDLPALRRDLAAVLDADDAFDLFPVDERGSRSRIRWQRPPERWGKTILW